MIAVGVTNIKWFQLLRPLFEIDIINFWRPGTANFKALQPGEIFYFLLASPIRKIGGYGVFKRFDHMTIEEAWNEFGIGNGVISLRDFRERMVGFDSSVPGAGTSNPTIGCVQLTSVVFLDDTEFQRPEELGIDFADSIVAYKKYPNLDLLQI